jgi:nucleoside 2-deoxyribosyltransferase
LKKGSVYLAGPIHGVEHDQHYRERLRQLLNTFEYDVIDPWEREKVEYSFTGEEWWRNVPSTYFIRRDLEDIDRCNVLIAFLPILSAGTCMELFYAKRKGKVTIVISNMESLSPWIIYHTDHFFKTIDEFQNHLEENHGLGFHG